MIQASDAAGPSRPRFSRSALAARAVEAALVALLAWIAAQALWFIIYGTDALDLTLAAPSGSPAAASLAAGRGPAGAAAGLFDARESVDAPARAAAPETRLDMTLRGVINAGDGTGSAVIETPGRGQRSLAAGAQIAPGVRLDAVYLDHVIINRRGTRESLFLTEAAAQRARERRAAPAPSAQPAPVSRGGATDSAIAPTGQPDLALAQALDRETWVDGLRLEPAVEGGRLTGMRVRESSSLQVLRASGLMPGDIITRLNGEPLTSAEAAARATRRLESAGAVVLIVRRGPEEIRLEASLP